MTETKARIRSKPQVVAETCICLAVQRAGRAIGRRFDEAFRSLNLTNWQYSILAILDDQGHLSIGELADLLGADRTTVTGNLKPLERRALVRIDPDASDRRIRLVSLTIEGRDLLAQGLRHWSQADRDACESLAGLDRQAFLTALTALAAPPRKAES